MKVLIVDDSALMRRQLGLVFERAGGFELAFARNGRDAVEQSLAFQPDVITLDINMPQMDGLDALAQIMLARPTPVVMVSSLTEKGALATFEALNLGAVDFIAKPGGTISLSLDAIAAQLLDKVRSAARVQVRSSAPSAAPAAPPAPAVQPGPSDARATRAANGVVLIGVSTGGPRTLEEILPRLPADFPWPVVVAQHMPASFTGPFASRIDKLCALEVVEASHPMALAPGRIYLCKGGADTAVVQRGATRSLIARPESTEYLWHPSVELLGRSALEHYPASSIIAVMLTGMGHDGADAFAEIARRGGRTIAQDSQSSVVFGMPAELIKRGGASMVLPAEQIAAQINAWLTP